MRRWQQRLSEKFILKPNQHGLKNFKLYLLKVICESLRSNPPLLYISLQQCFIHVHLDFDGEPTFEQNRKRSLIGKSCYIIKQIGIMYTLLRVN